MHRRAMGKEYQWGRERTQRIVARGFLAWGGKVLVVRELGEGHEYYNLPGGVVPFGVPPEEALAARIEALTGIPIVVRDPFYAASRVVERGATHVVELYFRVEPRSAERDAVPFSRTAHHAIALRWVEGEETGYFFSSHITAAIREGRRDTLLPRLREWLGRDGPSP